MSLILRLPVGYNILDEIQHNKSGKMICKTLGPNLDSIVFQQRKGKCYC